jgi:DNA-binding winged helix-turn-helix (wHTH) protein
LFEDHVLDTERRELRKGDAVLSVEPQVFDLLACLIRNRERVVGRDELIASVWDGRTISDSTFTTRINGARSAIGDNGEDQRLIRTVSRRGYRFVGAVHEEQAPNASAVAETASAAIAALPERPGDGALLAGETASETATADARGFRVTTAAAILALCAAAGVGAATATLIFLLWPGADASRSRPVASVQKFDATTVPLVSDVVRRSLAGYPARPDAKALAIAPDGWSIADGAPDIEAAQKEALRQCAARAKGVCRIYAVGMDVVLSKDALPLPATSDLRTEPLQIPLIVDDIPTLNSKARQDITRGYMQAPNHKALAVTTQGLFWVNNLDTRSEPARLAVERCTEATQRTCLLLSVDGFLTIQLPKTRRIARIFLPSTEADIPAKDRLHIARVYQGDEWRALARGKKGTWYPVAAAPSEAAAIEGALSACSQADEECRLYAIANFRVADD